MKKLRALLATLLVLVTVLVLASCGCVLDLTKEPDGTTVPTTPAPPPPVNTVDVIAGGASAYKLVLPNRSAIGGASDIGSALRAYVSANYGVSLKLMNDKAAADEGALEILIGDTNRDATASVVARLEEIAAADTYYYVVAEVNGQIVLYASASEVATNYSNADYETANFLLDYFLATYATADGIAVPEGCFDVQSITAQAYGKLMEEIELKKQENADKFRQEQIELLKQDIAGHRMADFGRITEMDNIYSEPLYTPTVGSHPRIMVTEETLPTVRARFEAAREEVTPAFRSLRDYYEAETDGLLPDTPEGTSNYNARILGIIESKAFYYLMTGDEMYGYEAIRAMKNFLLTFEIYEADLGGDICRQFGYIMYTVGVVYDWCYDLLTVADYNHFIAGVHTKIGPNMEVGFPPSKQGGVTGHGSESQVLRDYLGFAIAVYDERPSLYNYVCGRIQDVHVPPVNWYGESGSHWQGTNYGPFRFYNSVYAETLMTFMSNREHHFFDVGNMREMAMTFYYYLRPDDQMLWIGDTGNQGVVLGKSSSFALDFFYVACITQDTELMKCAMRFMGGNVKLSVGGTCLSPATYFCIYDPEVFEAEEESELTLPLVRYNGSPLGQFISRSKWDDGDAVMVYMKVAEAYSANHEHKDAGNFQIFYKGNLATDSGVYDTYVNPHGAGYYRQSVSSNTLLIFNPNYNNNGNSVYSGGQSIHKTGATNENPSLDVWLSRYTSSQAKIVGSDYETVFDAEGNEEYIYSYLAGDLTNAYDDDTVDEVSRYMISVMTGDPENPMAFVVYDRITSVDALYKKTFLLHVQEKPVIDDVMNTAVITNTKKPHANYQNNGKLFVQSLLSDVTYSMVGGSKGEEVNGVINETDMQFAIYSKKPIYEYNAETGTWSNTGTLKPLGYHNYPAYEYASTKYIHTPESGPYDPVEKLGDSHEFGWGRIEITPAEANLTDRLLTVMYVTDADNEAAQVMASEIKNDYFVGAMIFGKAVLFPVNANGKGYGEQMTFTVEGDGEIEYYISGLEAGQWCVSVGGTEVGSGIVSDKGILRISATAGEITLTPAFSSLEFDLGGGRLNSGIKLPSAYNYGDTFGLPTADTTAEMNSAVDIVKLGSKFLGWYDNAELTGDPITALDAALTGPQKFYAKWEKIFAVVDYEPNGGTINETYTYRLDDGASLIPPSDITLGGYYFIGWFADPACTPASRVEIVTTEYANAEGDVTLYAGWRVAFAAENYESESSALAQKPEDKEDKTLHGITYGVAGLPGAAFDTVTGEDGNTYLKWVGGEDSSAISIKGNLALMMNENAATSMTVALDLARLEEIAVTRAVLRLRGNGMTGVQAQAPLLHIGAGGEVYLGFGTSTVLTTLGTGFSELAVTVDFEEGKLYGYVDSELTATVDFTKPATGGGTNTLEWMATLSGWVVDFSATTPNVGVEGVEDEPAERTLLVDDIRAYIGAYGE